MKALRLSLVACAIVALAGTAMASTGSLVEFTPKVVPVVVHVNAQGKVTDILPAARLRPTERQLLIKQLDAWITNPAVVKGQPVASQFIVEVAPQPKSGHDGGTAANYTYVRSLPMPFYGAVHWNIINGGLEVALVSDTMGAQVQFSTSAAESPQQTTESSDTQPSAASKAHPMPTIDTSVATSGNSGKQ